MEAWCKNCFCQQYYTSKFSNADAAFSAYTLILSLLQVFKITFHLQIRIFLRTKQELKFFSSVPGSGCTFERSAFVVGEGRKRRGVGMLS